MCHLSWMLFFSGFDLVLWFTISSVWKLRALFKSTGGFYVDIYKQHYQDCFLYSLRLRERRAASSLVDPLSDSCSRLFIVSNKFRPECSTHCILKSLSGEWRIQSMLLKWLLPDKVFKFRWLRRHLPNYGSLLISQLSIYIISPSQIVQRPTNRQRHLQKLKGVSLYRRNPFTPFRVSSFGTVMVGG